MCPVLLHIFILLKLKLVSLTQSIVQERMKELAKHLKLSIKNTQIAEAIQLGGIKNRLAKKKEAAAESEQQPSKSSNQKIEKEESVESVTPAKEESPRIRARSKSAFAETASTQPTSKEIAEPIPEEEDAVVKKKTGEELRREIFKENFPESQIAEIAPVISIPQKEDKSPLLEERKLPEEPKEVEVEIKKQAPPEEKIQKEILTKPEIPVQAGPVTPPVKPVEKPQEKMVTPPPRVKLGPTGRHINDYIRKPTPVEVKKVIPVETKTPAKAPDGPRKPPVTAQESGAGKPKIKPKGIGEVATESEEASGAAKKAGKIFPQKEFRDVKPARRQPVRTLGGGTGEEDEPRWRKRRAGKANRYAQEDLTVRPTTLKVRVPISIKSLATEMKLKAAELIAKLFLQGVVVTLNDFIEDEVTLQLLGHEFGCEITIDTSEQERIRVTDKTVKEEIQGSLPDDVTLRPPVVAFMGHVDHGKTSLIDSIRKTNRAAGEAGAITQHIGAFRCSTPVGDITILDTPGHEAFSAMRARGADATDIVVLVVAGDEGVRPQTVEAIKHAKSAKVTIVVAINKSDKPNFNPENVYKQLADNELLPEAWGGETLTVNCSAVTGAGIKELLETLALQAEILELRSNPKARARGIVLESEMHKGMGSVATVLVQNGTLRLGDAIVFSQLWGNVKTMRDEWGHELLEATPSTPVSITGLSGLPDAGEEFIVVKNEREARDIAAARMQGMKQSIMLLKKKIPVENMFQQSESTIQKVLNIVLRADVQGSLEALKVALGKIQSKKVELNVIFAGVGEVSESDIQLAATSKAVVIGFHTQIESHAESMIKQLGVQVKLHDIIYHAIDDAKLLMVALLDKIPIETDKGKAEVRAMFKSSQVGNILGCIITEGTIHRNHHIRIMRQGKMIGKSSIGSIKRVKEDVREVSKGIECGIVLSKFHEVAPGDILEAYEVTYITQEL